MSDWHEMSGSNVFGIDSKSGQHPRHAPRVPPRHYTASDGAIFAALVVMSIAFALGVVCGVLLGRN